MKRFVAMAMSAAMICGMLTGCSGSTSSTTATTAAAAGETAAAETTAAGAADTTAETAAGGGTTRGRMDMSPVRKGRHRQVLSGMRYEEA